MLSGNIDSQGDTACATGRWYVLGCNAESRTWVLLCCRITGRSRVRHRLEELFRQRDKMPLVGVEGAEVQEPEEHQECALHTGGILVVYLFIELMLVVRFVVSHGARLSARLAQRILLIVLHNGTSLHATRQY